MNRTGMAALLAAATLTLAACGAAAPAGAPPDPVATTESPVQTMKSADPVESASPEGGAAVPEALRFSARTLDGQAFEGATLAGKPVVFWFWAPWCPKCRSDAPAVKAAASAHRDVAFVGVAGLDAQPAMREFVRSTGTGDLVHLSDQQGAVWTRLGVSQQSVFVFVKPGGGTTKVTGPLGRDGLEAEIAKIRTG
ncbi:redoxin domain-containing protein [Nonomuraea sp. NPDC048826]|uniref:redoxin domain-containing protein n=1 Tax=Nonomuraea sp. NPDC048826 TaxID=3364347 RepID=UPI00371F8634